MNPEILGIYYSEIGSNIWTDTLQKNKSVETRDRNSLSNTTK